MRKNRFTEEQIVRILREAGRAPIADVAKKHGISQDNPDDGTVLTVPSTA